MASISVGLPFELESVGPQSARRPVVKDGVVHLYAGAGADLFVDPAPNPDATLPDAERFVTQQSGDFTLSAFVEADTAEQYDSGVLLVWVSETVWAKICVEQDPQGRQRLVSVVTRGVSDDANGPILERAAAYLRVTRKGEVFGLHGSQDGKHWDLLRYFGLGVANAEPVFVGLLAQSPAGPGCEARFSQIKFTTQTTADLRSAE